MAEARGEQTLSAVFVGEESLAVSCASAWLEGGHEIRALVTDVDEMVRWAADHGVPVMRLADLLEGLKAGEPFDYLFSIVNFKLLSDELLGMPRRAAINFHDGPLPRYAGVNATNWAIMNGEEEHGISWHLMVEQVDAGPIFQQRIFPIRPDDTALTLNAKCYEEALGAFRDLVVDLSAGSAVATEQDLADRSVFGRWRRPSAAATLDWRRPAAEIDGLIRGLDFGPYANALGRPKVRLGGRVFVLEAAAVEAGPPGHDPGTVISVAGDVFTVACADGAVRVEALRDVQGATGSPAEFLEAAGFGVGDVLTLLATDEATVITETASSMAPHEEFWTARLSGLEIMGAPYAMQRPAQAGAVSYDVVDLPTPAAFLDAAGEDLNPQHAVTAAFLTFLELVAHRAPFDVGFRGVGQVTPAVSEPYFATHVPWRIEIEAGDDLVALTGRVSKSLAALERHRTYAHDLVVRAPRLSALDAAPTYPLIVDHLEGSETPSASATLVVRVAADGARSQWFYDPAVIPAEQIGRIHHQFLVVLESLAGDQRAVLLELDVLPDAELRQLEAWNETGRDYDLDTCLHYLFEEQVARTPDRVALSFDGTDLTYHELNQRANRLAHYLRSIGIGRSDLVGVAAERSLEMVVALYGIIKAGAAYVPMDPEYPSDRLAFMMEDAQVPVLLTQKHLLAQLPDHGNRIVCLDSEWEEIAASPDTNPDRIALPSDLAYVLYTSGSTGRPKGVMNEHRGVVNRLLWMQEAFGLGEDDRVLQKTPFSFDVSVWEFFWPLIVGARLVVAEPGGHKDGAYLVRTFQEEAITTVHFVPSMLQLFVEEPGIEACTPLRRIICSGEALPHDLQDRLFGRLDVELHNLYGPTEAAIDVTWWACDPDSELNFIPIGRAIANTQMHVLDGNGRRVPIGVAGELHIGGVQVARGYLNRDELTAEKFIPDPFSPDPDARLYSTGDLARFLPDGNIEYLGRIDFQVKIRGFRIELGEIETIMSQHEDVKEAVVLAREDQPGDKRLVGYLISTRAAPDLDDLRALLATQLAEYMVPSAFVEVESFPLTPNGKIDRKALPAPDLTALGEFTAPDSDFERRVAGIWASILNLNEVGTRVTFFDLGGHSLLIMRLAVQLGAEFGREVTVADLFRYPTVQGQAGFLAGSPEADHVLGGAASAVERKRKAAQQRQRRRTRRGPDGPVGT